MNHALRKRLVSRKLPATGQRRRIWLCLEQLEDRCQPSVTGFSTITEVGNNTANPTQGTAGTELLRLSPPAYKPVANGGDGLNTPALTYGAPTFVAGPRLVSNIVDNQAAVLFGAPSTDINTVDQNGLSDFGYTFGQFMDHDMDLTPTQSSPAPPGDLAANKDGPNGFPIPVDPNQPTDPIGSLAFTRSVFDPTTGITTPREQINSVTSYLDLSNVYGSNQTVADALRTHSGGLLKTSPGNLLPYDSTAINPLTGTPYFTQDQINALNMANDSGAVSTDQLFAAGDVRANENVELTALQTLFMRNHNAIATQLAKLDPKQFGFTTSWTDQNLYQEARKLNIAEYQKIIYTQYLPDLLGPNAMPAYTGYNASVDASIATEFSTVAFRFGHSMLNNNVARDNNNGSPIGSTTLQLAQDFFDPNLISSTGGIDPLTGLTSTGIGALLKGDADNTAQAMDVMAVSDIRNLLFGNGPPGSPTGDDLIARDIWRADDDGIGTYNQVRVAFGLAPITIDPNNPNDVATDGFDQISSDPTVVAKLLQAYTGASRNVPPDFLSTGHTAGDINPFIAGLAEDHVPGSDMGPLFTKILVDQFTRLETGDQYFYLNESFNLQEKVILFQGATLGKVIEANTPITNLQSDVFRVLSQESGQSSRFYTTSSGQTALTGSPTGTTLTTSVYNSLLAALANPNKPGYLVLVDSRGNYEPVSLLQSYSNLSSYLRSLAPATWLSTELLTAEINVTLGKVDPTTSVYLPAVPGMFSVEENSLATNGVGNRSGIASVQSILNASINELLASTTAHSISDALFRLALNTALDGIDSNEAIFIL